MVQILLLCDLYIDIFLHNVFYKYNILDSYLSNLVTPNMDPNTFLHNVFYKYNILDSYLSNFVTPRVAPNTFL